MTDWWTDLAAPDPPPATAQPTRRRAPAKPRAATIPFADAWILFRLTDDGEATDLRVTRGSLLNRLPPGQPRDWTHEIGLAAYAPGDPAAAWREWCRLWRMSATERGGLMDDLAAVEGLEWLASQAAYWRMAHE